MSALICVVAIYGGVSAPVDAVEAKAVVLRAMHDVDVPAQETGPLVEMAVKEGQSISEGTLLARIDDSDAKSAVAEATADLEVASVEANSDLAIESAQKELDAATKKVRSTEAAKARNDKAVRQFELDDVLLAETQARLALSRAKLSKQKALKAAAAKSERVKRAKEQLKRHAVTSPISGSVVQSKFERGEWVEAGQVIARVVQTDRLKAEGLLDPGQITPGMVGSPVIIEVRIGNRLRKLRGTVTFISSEAHPTAHTVRVRAVVDNPGKLVRPGVKGCSLTIHARTVMKPAGPNR